MAEQEIGVVAHYYDKIQVAAIRLTKGALKTGDTVHIRGQVTDLRQVVTSIQIEHAAMPEAKLGDEVGVKVDGRVHEHDKVFKLAD
jgi:translation elongation factor EF-1alpha